MTCLDDIKRFRKERGITQREMGRMVRLSQSSYGRIENGKGKMPISMLEKIANVLGKRMLILFIDK